ncbi:MAG: nucleoside kinase, partial [Chitinophagaceae bacterium]|nr:nucleoside kinase [Anaerolineae bacterium]
MPQNLIKRAEPRETIRVTLDNGLILEGDVGTTAGEFLAEATNFQPQATPLIAAICDGQLRELSYVLKRDAMIAPVLLASSDGGRIYRRSLVMLMTTAAGELWAGCQVSVRYSVPDGGFYCARMDGKAFSPQELEQLESQMRRISTEDSPITKRIVPLEEAIALFGSRNEDDKIRLLEQRTRQELTLYTLRGRDDYYYGYMVPSTGVLSYFRLIWVRDGFILQYPLQEDPLHLRPLRAYDKLSKVFRQADDWLQRLDIEDVGRLNRIVREGDRLQELILVAEALHEQNIAHIAHEITERHHNEGVRLVLIAGPSSSGKTTFSKRLAIQLLAHGIRPMTLELDNYFVDRELTPRDEKGDYDFEALGAINLPLFNQQLLELTRQEEVQIPRFDFHSGKSIQGRIIRLRENQITIIEGIHGLNPGLVPDIPPQLVYRVY